MTEYRRAWLPGATCFFTVNLAERRGNRLLVERIDVLRSAFRSIRARHPFHVDAAVILPNHLHCVWTLPPADTDCSTRWSLIKGHFSRAIEKSERISQSRAKRGGRGRWQRRLWEHLIRNQGDFNRHVDYVHWNPGKTRMGSARSPTGLMPVSIRSGGEGSIRRIEAVRTSQVLPHGSTASDALPFVHRILFDYLEGSSSLEDFLEDFPSVSRETAVAVIEAARARLFADAFAA